MRVRVKDELDTIYNLSAALCATAKAQSEIKANRVNFHAKVKVRSRTKPDSGYSSSVASQLISRAEPRYRKYSTQQNAVSQKVSEHKAH